MPRTIDPLLKQMYERANPNACEFVEIAQPDVGQVLRRWVDQFSINPPRLSETPSGTTQQSPGGGMMLKGTLANLASMYNDNLGGIITLDINDTSRFIRGVGWSIDAAIKPTRILRFTAKLHVSGSALGQPQFELQVWRMRGVPGRVINGATGAPIAQIIQWTPTPLLPQPARIADMFTLANQTVDAVWDLTAYQLDIEHRNIPAPSLFTVGEIPEYIFTIGITDPVAKGRYEWRLDNTSTRTVAGAGTFQDVLWQKEYPVGTPAPDPSNPASVWVRSQFSRVPCFKIDIETYPATSQEVYAITLPRVPSAASTGRIRFIRETPLDTTATLELSTAGSGGPWTGVAHQDVVSTKQATYHLRATLNGSADTHRSPVLEEIGIEFRTPVDVTAEATVDAMPQDVNVPFLDSAIGEGKATVVRTGRRDYHDPASDLLAVSAATQLELDHYLGSRHPALTRDKWLHLGRYIVSAAEPTPTAEIFSLISYLKILEKKIPIPAETVNQVLAAASGTTATAILIAGTLPGTSVGGEYTGLNYYVRIVSTAVAGLAAGMVFPVTGNATIHELDVATMPAALAIGDAFELHSAIYGQVNMSWANADPADVWYEILTVWAGVPPERIGRADIGRVGRSGYPPKLTDRAPGDTATQNKLRVSRTIKQQVKARDLINQLSLIMGGTTVEIGGQIVFRQLYPILDPLGNLVIAPEEVAATFDARDYSQLQTPRGLESRITTMQGQYGVDSALGSDAAKPSTVVFSDADALAWFTQQDLHEIGNSAIPDEIAAWCYNTYDGGLYLASTLCRQGVRACSTGLRQWPFTVVDMHPDLVAGDRVVVLADQYTDYDPTTKTSLRGLVAYSFVLVHVARLGRDLRGYMLGLNSAVQVVGGSGTVSTGRVGQPSIGNVDFNAAGELLVSVNQTTPPGGGFRVAASTSGVPSVATVDAATWVQGQSATVNLGSGGPWTAGATVQISVIAYASQDTAGARSLMSNAHAVVAGGSSSIFIDTLAQAAPNYVANTVALSWVGHGTITSYDIYVSEALDGGSASYVPTTGVTSPYTFTSAYNIATAGAHVDTLSFYVIGKDAGGHVIATSPTNTHNYLVT